MAGAQPLGDAKDGAVGGFASGDLDHIPGLELPNQPVETRPGTADSVNSRRHWFVNGITRRRHRLQNLPPATRYRIRLRAWNIVGISDVGKWGYMSTARTLLL